MVFSLAVACRGRDCILMERPRNFPIHWHQSWEWSWMHCNCLMITTVDTMNLLMLQWTLTYQFPTPSITRFWRIVVMIWTSSCHNSKMVSLMQRLMEWMASVLYECVLANCLEILQSTCLQANLQLQWRCFLLGSIAWCLRCLVWHCVGWSQHYCRLLQSQTPK